MRALPVGPLGDAVDRDGWRAASTRRCCVRCRTRAFALALCATSKNRPVPAASAAQCNLLLAHSVLREYFAAADGRQGECRAQQRRLPNLIICFAQQLRATTCRVPPSQPVGCRCAPQSRANFVDGLGGWRLFLPGSVFLLQRFAATVSAAILLVLVVRVGFCLSFAVARPLLTKYCLTRDITRWSLSVTADVGQQRGALAARRRQDQIAT